ncbi:hypothetical protein [Nostoc sp. NMS8]|uniref:hypothetical protein n=1 Tax=Nostoc sp. NMS8 TaxID=2815392 RepID=UPI0025E2BD01|nr:hypothetical protein [Nostoc sp. NMS8]MBN3958122.1 hypothetical protein [Nostoc sp. NMS8]
MLILPYAMSGAIANFCRSAGYTYAILVSLRQAGKSTTPSPLRVTYLIKNCNSFSQPLQIHTSVMLVFA